MSFILILLSVLLLTVPNYLPNLYFLSWFSFLAFFYYIYSVEKQNFSYKNIFLTCWSFAFGIHAFTANFLYHPLKLYTGFSFIIIIFILILLFLFLSLIYAFFLTAYFYLQRTILAKTKLMPLLFAVIWTLMEITRHYVLGFFPIANLAYTQTEFLAFIQLAEIGGIWVLTFILVYFNALFFNLTFEQEKKNILIIFFLFIAIFAFNNQKISNSSEAAELSDSVTEIKIGIITTKIDQNSKWSSKQLAKNIELTLNSALKLKEADLIIAPETNLTFDFYNDTYYREKFLAAVAKKFKFPVQIGALAGKEKTAGRYNSSFLISAEGEILQRYNKNLLLLFGEKFPFENFLNQYSPYSFSSLNSGTKNNLFKFDNLKWKTVICSEILYPDYLQLEGEKVDFIVNQTNEAWFNNSSLLKNIMWQAAVMRAVENRIPIIKTGNLSHSGIIYPSGNYKKVNSEQNYHLLKISSKEYKEN